MVLSDSDSVSWLCRSHTERTTEGCASRRTWYPEGGTGRWDARLCVLLFSVWRYMCLVDTNTTKHHNRQWLVPCRWQGSNLRRVSVKLLLWTRVSGFHRLPRSWVASSTKPGTLSSGREVGWFLTAVRPSLTRPISMGLVESALAGFTDFFCFYDLRFFFPPLSLLEVGWHTHCISCMFYMTSVRCLTATKKAYQEQVTRHVTKQFMRGV